MLLDLATIYRIINLYSHHAHNMAKGQTFLEDHSFFGDIYGMADGFYDDVIERHIGTTDKDVDVSEIVIEASKILKILSNDFMKNILMLLEEALGEIDDICKDSMISTGTKNLVQDHADKIEVLIYKLKRKMK